MIRVPTQGSSRLLPLIGYMFIFIGGALTAVGGLKISEARSSSSWPAVTGTVLTSTVEKKEATRTRNNNSNNNLNRKRRLQPPISISKDNKEKTITFLARVTYGYSVDGADHVGDRIAIVDVKSRDKSQAEQISGRYPEGSEVEVYYDPEDPAASVLEPGMHGGAYIPLAIGLILFLLGGGITIVRRKMQASAVEC